jgi:hypothetical protein
VDESRIAADFDAGDDDDEDDLEEDAGGGKGNGNVQRLSLAQPKAQQTGNGRQVRNLASEQLFVLEAGLIWRVGMCLTLQSARLTWRTAVVGGKCNGNVQRLLLAQPMRNRRARVTSACKEPGAMASK